jgi:hypothetical protein
MFMSSGHKFARPLLAAMLCIGAAFLFGALPAMAAPVAVAPYTLATFTGIPPSGATAPDDLAVSADGADLWIGYGNGVDTHGKGGPSNLVEYNISNGTVVQNLTIPGHLDGLKIDPSTGEVWATENEDGSPTLAIVNPKTGKFKIFPVSSPLITGGFDDIVFTGAGSFIVASSQVDTITPVIVQVSIKGKKKKTTLSFTSALPGAPSTVFNVVTNAAESGDVIADPDSMTLDPAGEFVLDDRTSHSLFIVRNSSAPKPVLRVPLTLFGLPDVPLEVNDTIFTTSEVTGESSTAGVIFITDTTANKIYVLTKPYFPSNEVYTAANVVKDVGLVDLNTGIVVPVVTGFMGVHGLAFSPTPVAVSTDTGNTDTGK